MVPKYKSWDDGPMVQPSDGCGSAGGQEEPQPGWEDQVPHLAQGGTFFVYFFNVFFLNHKIFAVDSPLHFRGKKIDILF
jgi:hypothetical protein